MHGFCVSQAQVNRSVSVIVCDGDEDYDGNDNNDGYNDETRKVKMIVARRMGHNEDGDDNDDDDNDDDDDDANDDDGDDGDDDDGHVNSEISGDNDNGCADNDDDDDNH